MKRTFDGPDYKNEDHNKFKNVFLVKYYPVLGRSNIEVYDLGDLGRIKEESIWGHIEYIRQLFDEFKIATYRHHVKGRFAHHNNSIYFITKAKDVHDALTIFWEKLQKGEG